MAQAISAVLWNPQILINSVDLSSKARKVKLEWGQEKKEVTAFGNTARSYIPSMMTPSLEVEFYVDRTSGGVTQTLQNMVVGPGGATFPVSVRALNSAGTTSNMIYTLTVTLDGTFQPINGQVGDPETTTVKFANAGTANWTVATTS